MATTFLEHPSGAADSARQTMRQQHAMIETLVADGERIELVVSPARSGWYARLRCNGATLYDRRHATRQTAEAAARQALAAVLATRHGDITEWRRYDAPPWPVSYWIH